MSFNKYSGEDAVLKEYIDLIDYDIVKHGKEIGRASCRERV